MEEQEEYKFPLKKDVSPIDGLMKTTGNNTIVEYEYQCDCN